MLISPLARKLCAKQGIDPSTLRGSGPRGRIMAADVKAPQTAPASRGKTALTDFATPPTRPEIMGYYVYDGTVDMSALGSISLPIAVQCERLLENRYSLFDYIVRAVVKACISCPAWVDAGGAIDVLLFENNGEKVAAICDAGNKTIFRIARETQHPAPVPETFAPHIVVCDISTSRAQVLEHLRNVKRPAFGFVVRGGSPKVGIRAGREELHDFSLSYTFYAATTLAEQEANRIAARLQAHLYNPVSLLLLSK